MMQGGGRYRQYNNCMVNVFPVPHLVPGMVLKSLYHLHSVPLTVLISNTSSGLFQQTQYLTNIWTLRSTIMETLLDQSNERVVTTELATSTELGVDILHVPTTSLQFTTSNYRPCFFFKVSSCKRITGEGFTNCENGDNSK